MSYDVYCECDTCDSSHGTANHTANQAALFYEVLAGGIPGLDGLPCPEAAAHLRAAIEACEAMPDLSKYDAPNKWGTGASGLNFLREILAQCERWPKLRVRVSA